jgi:hypothetical protein
MGFADERKNDYKNDNNIFIMRSQAWRDDTTRDLSLNKMILITNDSSEKNVYKNNNA